MRYLLDTNICIYTIKHKKKCGRRKKQIGTFNASCKYRDLEF